MTKIQELEIKIQEQIHKVLPFYHTVAVHFAGLHDTPQRMLEKKCIKGIVPWKESRRIFYWRLHRKLLEDSIVKKILHANMIHTYETATNFIQRWFFEDKNNSKVNFSFTI